MRNTIKNHKEGEDRVNLVFSSFHAYKIHAVLRAKFMAIMMVICLFASRSDLQNIILIASNPAIVKSWSVFENRKEPFIIQQNLE